MSLVSMTGFARVDGAASGAVWHWEARSVNGKSLDVRCRLPAGYEVLEQYAREQASRRFRRGNIQLSLQLQAIAGDQVLRLNPGAFESAIDAASIARKKLPEAPPVTIEGLLALRGVLEQVDAASDPAARDAQIEALQTSLDELLAELATMRQAEGEKLQAFVAEQVSQIERIALAARQSPARSVETIQARLTEQVARLQVTGSGLDVERLHQEAVLLAAKTDIQEELDRLDSHVAAARSLIGSKEAAGRKLDFLAQEFNREANTLCSKANDPQLSALGLELKAVIDQLREQVQNIE